VRHQRRLAAGDVAAGLAAARRARRACVLGIHPHDDAGLAVANALAAVRGRRPPRAGHGQRLRRALRQRRPADGARQPRPEARRGPAAAARRAAGLSRYVDERANLEPNVRRPYVGDAAFAHKGGVHVSAVNRRPDTYEHVPPGVGRQRAAGAALRPLRPRQPGRQGRGPAAQRGGRATRPASWSRASRSSSTSATPSRAPRRRSGWWRGAARRAPAVLRPARLLGVHRQARRRRGAALRGDRAAGGRRRAGPHGRRTATAPSTPSTVPCARP
jgi:hypothetical protein